MIKSGKKVIAIILTILMVITSAPFIAFADEPIDELKSAISAYETKMDGTVYTNMKDAYTAYFNAVKARDAYVNGYRDDIDLAPITAALNTKTAAMQKFTPSFTTVKPSFHGDDLSAYEGTAYNNVLYSPQVDSNTATAENTNARVKYELFYATTVLAYDGTTQLRMPVMVSAQLTYSKTRYLYGSYPTVSNTDMTDHPELALTGLWYSGDNVTGWSDSNNGKDGNWSFAAQLASNTQTFGYNSNTGYGSNQSTATRSQELPQYGTLAWWQGRMFYAANIMNINTTFADGEYLKTYQPHWYICASDSPNSTYDATMMRGSNIIYVINYKAYTDALANNAAKLATIHKFNKTPDRVEDLLEAYDTATAFNINSYNFEDSSKIVEAADRIQTLCETLADKNSKLTDSNMSDYNKLFSAIDAYDEIYLAGNADGKYDATLWEAFAANFERAVNAAGNIYENGYAAEYDGKSIAYIAEALDFLLDKSGELGDNATYEFDSTTGVVTISGSGDLGDFTGTDSPFAGNTKITTVVIEDGVTTIGDNMFNGCTGLETVTIPDSVTNIGESAFQDCSSLTTITVPAGASYGDDAFTGCTSLEVVEFGSGEIASKDDADHNAPWYQPSVKEIVITPGVTKIGEHAFSDATNIERLTVPCDIPVNTSSNTNAFEGMTGLKYITITPGTTGTMINWGENNYYKRSPWYGNRNNLEMHVTIENGVKNIASHAFYECSNIDDITIPGSVDEIGERAFYGCTSLDDIYFYNPNCEIYDSPFTLRELIKIHGFDASTAQSYANKYTREFILMGDHTHNYVAVVTAPTCTAQGYTTYTCSCGANYVADYVDPTGHDWNDGEVTVKPTCTTTGTKVYTCKNDSSHTYSETVAKVAHTWEATSTTATCTTPGITNYTCSVCTSTKTEVEPALGHDYNGTVTQPTCTEQGYTTYNCSRCESTYVGSYVAALGHNYSSTIIAPTCSDFGYTQNVCTRCGNTTQTDYKPTNNNHDWDAGTRIKDPNCTEQGQILHTCNRNPQHTYIEYIAANGHSWDSGVVTAATCSAQGYTTYTCTECGTTKKGNYTGVNPNNHKWNAGVVTAPTCTAQGYTTYTCKDCKITKKGNYTNATGHVWDNGVVTKVATVEETGIKTYTCKNNSAHKKTEVIPMAKVAPVPSAAEANKAPVNTKIPKINAGKISTVSNLKTKKMNVKFNKVSGAQNYRVAFRKAGAKKWSYYWTGGKSAYVFKNLKKNQMYEFMFAAYRKNAKGKWERGNWSGVSYRYFAKGTLKKLTTKKKTVTATWAKDKNAANYEVFYSTNKNMSKAKKIKVSKKKTSYTIKNLKKGKTYYVRIRVNRTKNKKLYYGEFSNIKKIKCK